MRISDWSSDVCSSDLRADPGATHPGAALCPDGGAAGRLHRPCGGTQGNRQSLREGTLRRGSSDMSGDLVEAAIAAMAKAYAPYSNFSVGAAVRGAGGGIYSGRSEEQTSELQSLMRISYAVFCLKNKKPESEHKSTRI